MSPDQTPGTHSPVDTGTDTGRADLRDWLSIYVKGFCMGAADIVPGVSGGTIALIVGIYERLVVAIASLHPHVLVYLPRLHHRSGRDDFLDALREMDLAFLLVLGAGIGTAVLVMARIMVVIFETYPAQLNAFFFGLIAASAVVVGKDLSVRSAPRIAVGIVGFGLAFFVTGTNQLLAGGSLPLVFLAGAIAISAMILPGISGAAFLYILGQYETLLTHLSDLMDAVAGLATGGSTAALVESGIVVGTFMTGAVVGLLTMARVVSWALSHYRMATLVFLVALMLGALRLPVIEIRAALGTPTPAEWASLLAAVVIGIGIILLLDWYTETLSYAASE